MTKRTNRTLPGPCALAAATILALVGAPTGHTQSLTLLAGGDIEWLLELYSPGIYYEPVDGWRPVPRVLTEAHRAELRERQPELLAKADDHYHTSIRYGLRFESEQDQARHPFQRLAPLFRAADLSFANLETALSDRARPAYDKALRTPAAFADGIAWAGIDVVSIANNHAMDAEGEGLMDTMHHLREAGVGFAGGGRDLEEARRPLIVERNGVRLAILAYTQLLNYGIHGFALPRVAGVAPLDPVLVKEDIRRVRGEVDHVIVSFHWDEGGEANSSTVTDPNPRAVALAREVIDAGASIILGHHPPIPRAVEFYNGGVIFYSLGKLIFGHNHVEWTDNHLARVTIGKDRVEAVEIIPVAGEGIDMAQPYPLEDARAGAVLDDLRRRSEPFGTRVDVVGSVGWLSGPSKRAPTDP
jgi:poly-gamma-glutamate capsule biosynthesis protein CapA/YwtB (metallophosphatase superfamily)